MGQELPSFPQYTQPFSSNSLNDSGVKFQGRSQVFPVGDTTVNDGEFDVPFIMLNPLAVTKKNINATIIDSGFHMKEEVYLNRPEEMP